MDFRELKYLRFFFAMPRSTVDSSLKTPSKKGVSHSELRIANQYGKRLDDFRRWRTVRSAHRGAGRCRRLCPATRSTAKKIRCGNRHRNVCKQRAAHISMRSTVGSLMLLISCAACAIGLTLVCSTIPAKAALIWVASPLANP